MMLSSKQKMCSERTAAITINETALTYADGSDEEKHRTHYKYLNIDNGSIDKKIIIVFGIDFE